MAKPNQDQGRQSRRKAEPEVEQVQEVEEDITKDANDSEQKQNAEHNTLGNAAIQNQMIGAGTPNADGEGGGGGMSVRQASHESGREYGGEDDDEDVPLTLDDLIRSWNPGTNKSKDRPSWLEPMPGDELPPEDPDYLAAVRSDGTVRVPASSNLDSQLQPSSTVVAASLIDWTRQGLTWGAPDLLDRVVARSLVPGTSFLHDLDGRTLYIRSRMGAISSLLLQRGPDLSGTPKAADIGFVAFCMNLAGHRRHAEMVRIDPGVEGKQMPKTIMVFERSFQRKTGRVTPRDLPDDARLRLRPIFDALLELEDPGVYLPTTTEGAAPIPEDADPLGLDAILAEFTGAPPDPEEPHYYAALQSAERLAAATARTRIHVAATGVAIAQVAKMYTAGPPMETLHHIARSIDEETDKNLRLLVEVARAAKRRTVAPKGLRAGLKRAVRALRAAQNSARDQLSAVVGGILPGIPAVLPQPDPVMDVLFESWMDGSPRRALPWLASLPTTPEQQASVVLTELAGGKPVPERAMKLLNLAADVTCPLHQEILKTLAGPCLLLAQEWEAAVALGAEQTETAVQRRNGMLLVCSTLLSMEAHLGLGDAEAAKQVHLDGGRKAVAIGSPAALSALARYTTVS